MLAESAALPVKHRLLILQEGIRQLAHSANQLLTLARADPSVNIATKNQHIALAAVAGEVVARFFDRALNSNIDLGADVAPVSIVADPSLNDDLLSNLVDNALKYTPAGGSVTVSARSSNGKAQLTVEDTGPGIPGGIPRAGAAEILQNTQFAGSRQRSGLGHRRGGCAPVWRLGHDQRGCRRPGYPDRCALPLGIHKFTVTRVHDSGR